MQPNIEKIAYSLDLEKILQDEVKGSVDFFLKYTNFDKASNGFGLTADSTKKTDIASIAAVGFALTAWVIACERGFISRKYALYITRKTLETLLHRASHFRGFFAHFLNMKSAERSKRCEYSTIDTSICLNGVITASAYFHDDEIEQLAQQILQRVDWNFFVFERNGKMLFRMAYNPDVGGDYVMGLPGFIYQWDMAAEQKMMYLQAAGQIEPSLARKLYQGFSRDIGFFKDQKIIINPGGNLFAYQFSEAWLDTVNYLDPYDVNWFNNTRLAALANRSFCIEHSQASKTYHANSWGISCGDSPWGYDVSGAQPCFGKPKPNGTVSIFGALGCLPFLPELTTEMIIYLYQNHPQAWGEYGFIDAYNLDVSPPWYSNSIYGIDKGCSMIMIENYLSRLIWDTYTNSPDIQKALVILGFHGQQGENHE